MKILLVHNYYGSESPSGENLVYETERKLLIDRGNSVVEFTRSSDEIRSSSVFGLLRGAFATPWNPAVGYEVRRVVEEFRPDVVHVHNTFPLISPSLFHYIGSRAAKVLTLHNYRLFCPAAIPLRNGIPCTECLVRQTVTPSLIHGCYRASRIATAPLAFSVALHRAIGTWRRKVDAFIALTDFQRSMMIDAGLPPDRVFTKPNFYPGYPEYIDWDGREDFVIYAGRLTGEKGVATLIEAWRLLGAAAPPLLIIGDGDLKANLVRNSHGLPVRFLGRLSADETHKLISRAKLIVVPSECYEGFPLVVREAFAFGTPVVSSDVNPLPSIIDDNSDGYIFKARNAASLSEKIRMIWGADDVLQKASLACRHKFKTKYDEESNYATLLKIYRAAGMFCGRPQNG